jgi:hypothetical protein
MIYGKIKRLEETITRSEEVLMASNEKALPELVRLVPLYLSFFRFKQKSILESYKQLSETIPPEHVKTRANRTTLIAVAVGMCPEEAVWMTFFDVSAPMATTIGNVPRSIGAHSMLDFVMWIIALLHVIIKISAKQHGVQDHAPTEPSLPLWPQERSSQISSAVKVLKAYERIAAGSYKTYAWISEIARICKTLRKLIDGRFGSAAAMASKALSSPAESSRNKAITPLFGAVYALIGLLDLAQVLSGGRAPPANADVVRRWRFLDSQFVSRTAAMDHSEVLHAIRPSEIDRSVEDRP